MASQAMLSSFRLDIQCRYCPVGSMDAGSVAGFTRRSVVGAIAFAPLLPLTAFGEDAARPVIGFLRSSPSGPFRHLVAAFREGLAEAGLEEGENVSVEYRWANNDLARLPLLAAELERLGVRVLVGNSLAIEAAREAAPTLPLVFVTADDPVKSGYVESLNSPGGNITGVTFFAGGQLGAKRLELLKELMPGARRFAILFDPNYPGFQTELPNIETAARRLEIELMKVAAAHPAEFAPAFEEIRRRGAGGILLGGSPMFTGARKDLTSVAQAHSIPVIYDQRDHVAAGGLISYGASFTGAYRLAGKYAGLIATGTQPSELPVVQPAELELVVNLRTAAALGLDVPETILLRADEVIE